jgi:hypothetical protein
MQNLTFEDVRQAVQNGALGISHIAKEANVHIRTVSSAVKGRRKTHNGTRRLIVDAAKKILFQNVSDCASHKSDTLTDIDRLKALVQLRGQKNYAKDIQFEDVVFSKKQLFKVQPSGEFIAIDAKTASEIISRSEEKIL